MAANATAEKARNVVLVDGAVRRRFLLVRGDRAIAAGGVLLHVRAKPSDDLARGGRLSERVLERQNGPTILVGHSFSGMIGTEAGVHPNVSALVYMAARARCGRGLYRLGQDVSDAAGDGWHCFR